MHWQWIVSIFLVGLMADYATPYKPTKFAKGKDIKTDELMQGKVNVLFI